MFEVKQGDNFGWPYCYFDPEQKKKVLAPEYGGDGKTAGPCSDVTPTVIGFPAHMAPNGLLFYTGNQFPDKYKNGAFIAFHGSWNRAPLPQKGFFVAFVPFQNGKPSGDWEIFADNFSGMETVTSTGAAKYRPCGLAQGPDGALYVTDDSKGSIWKITYAK
jgi:glucose/arabinose dehydrogenase